MPDLMTKLKMLTLTEKERKLKMHEGKSENAIFDDKAENAEAKQRMLKLKEKQLFHNSNKTKPSSDID